MKSKEGKEKEGKVSEITSLQPSSPKKLRSQNITQRLFQRQLGGKRIARQFTSSCISNVFGSLTLRKLLVMHDPANERHKYLSASLKKVSKISEILSVDDILIVLERSGLCVAFDIKTGKQLCYLNVEEHEYVQSVFHNKPNEAIVTVFIDTTESVYQMRCRSFPLQFVDYHLIRRGRPDQGNTLFESEVFTFPGFVEFDATNSKILTYSAIERRYRMWSLKNYQFLFQIEAEGVAEVKISPGILLITHTPKRGYIPFTLLSTETGEVIKEFNQLVHRSRPTELIEAFNEFLILKQKGTNLQIIDVLQNTCIDVNHTHGISPNGFVFLFERRLFLTLKGRHLLIWNFQGEQVTRFENHELMSDTQDSSNICISKDQDMIISYCTHESGGSINVSDTTTGESIAKLTSNDLKFANESLEQRFRGALDGTSAVYFNEDRSELYTGTQDGKIFVWGC